MSGVPAYPVPPLCAPARVSGVDRSGTRFLRSAPIPVSSTEAGWVQVLVVDLSLELLDLKASFSSRFLFVFHHSHRPGG